MNAPALFSLERQGYSEVVISGILACRLGRKLFCSEGQQAVRLPMRSLLKPWQLIAALGHIREPNDIIGCASHSGLASHIAALNQFASSLDLDTDVLRCPESFPMDSRESWRLQTGLAHKSRIFHPCSGKHLAYAAAMDRAGRRGADYLSTDSPVHLRLVKMVQEAGVDDQHWVTDSCGLPSLVTTIASMSQLWSGLGKVSGASTLLKYWSERPELIGGPDRLDSLISIQSAGRLIAKEGADGLLAVRSSSADDETSIIVKLSSGYNPVFLAVGLLSAIQGVQSELGREWIELMNPLRERIAKTTPTDQQLNIFSVFGRASF
jgi:L-asparaginase II